MKSPFFHVKTSAFFAAKRLAFRFCCPRQQIAEEEVPESDEEAQNGSCSAEDLRSGLPWQGGDSMDRIWGFPARHGESPKCIAEVAGFS